MSERIEHLRVSIQKLTEAIWHLDQLGPLESELKVQYSYMQEARAYLMELLKAETRNPKQHP
ncbi:MAG TPA: hypothetical protein VLV31_04335 [Candidatus Acidoferrales bacterium]|nr:hypothetical protein [Candidatus Acidoferrales bacterium]